MSMNYQSHAGGAQLENGAKIGPSKPDEGETTELQLLPPASSQIQQLSAPISTSASSTPDELQSSPAACSSLKLSRPGEDEATPATSSPRQFFWVPGKTHEMHLSQTNWNISGEFGQTFVVTLVPQSAISKVEEIEIVPGSPERAE